MIPKALSIVMGAVWTALAAWALGRLLYARLRVALRDDERDVLSFLTGAGLLSTLIFGLAAAHLIYDITFWAVGAASMGALAWSEGKAGLRIRLPRASWWFWAIYVPFSVAYVICAMAPEMSPDGSSYHLGILGTYYRAHGLVKITTHMYANLSQGVELLFLMAYAFGRHSGAALLHCVFLLALPLAMVAYGRRMAAEVPLQVAALFVLASPVMGVDGTSAYIDVAVAAGLFGVFYLVEIWRAEQGDGLAAAIGLAAGFGYAMKYTAFLAIPYALVVLAWRGRRWRTVLVCGACAAVMVLPWEARNSLWYGNPFSPLLNRWFPNPYVHVSFEQDYAEFMQTYPGLASHWEIPLEVTVRGKVLCGLLGPLFLLSPLALLALRSALGRRTLAAGLLFALPYAANVGTRFLIPALPFVAIALALVVTRWWWLGIGLAYAHAMSAIPPLTAKYCDEYAWRIARIPLRAAVRKESEDSWLNHMWPSYRIAKMVDQKTPKEAVVFTFTPFSESYTTREVRVGYQSAEGERLRDQTLAAIIPEWQAQQQMEFQYPKAGFRRLRVEQTAGNSKDLWSVYEFRVLEGERELPRGPQWKLRASPFIWDVQRAFDNSRATRWRSWQRLEPGMFLEVEFPAPVESDRVRLEVSPDQWAVRLRLSGEDASGQWKTLGDAPAMTGLTPTLGLRREAMEEMKRHGVTHLLLSGDDFGFADFEQNAALWGLRLVGQVDDTRLYRID